MICLSVGRLSVWECRVVCRFDVVTDLVIFSGVES